MAIAVSLSLDSRPVGVVIFQSLLLFEPNAYGCEPEDILTEEEAESLARQLRRLPACHSGSVGKYQWQEGVADTGGPGLRRSLCTNTR